MKYVQSFWSKPILEAFKDSGNTKNYFAGFPNRFVFLCAWTYSCLSIRKYYPNLHLVTDDYGIKIFRDALDLPYQSFSTELNDLSEFPSYLWAFGKLHVYRLQKEPFCHLDGDVFLFGPVLNKIINAPLFFQSYDHDVQLYAKVNERVRTSFRSVPKGFQSELKENLRCINAGVIGGNDIDLIQSYTDQAFELISQNLDRIDPKNSWELNLYCEQFLISNMMDCYDIPSAFLFSEPDTNNRYNFADFENISRNTQYVHLYFNKKRKTEYLEQIIARLQLEYPEYYKRILKVDLI